MALIVRDITVEIDTKRIVEGVSFDVRAGDKVGLVGRNGAGKTTLFRVLGGAAEPISGTVAVPDATGYLSQDPRSDRTPLDTNCLIHILSGRGLDEAMDRIAKMTVALEADPSTENIEAFSAAHEHFESLGGYAAESDARRLADGLGLQSDRLDLQHRRARPAASAAVWSSPASCSPAATCSCWTSRPTTWTRTPVTGCCSSCAPSAAPWWSSATTWGCWTSPSPGCSTWTASPRTAPENWSSTAAPTPST